MKLFGLMLAMVMVFLVFVNWVWAGPKHYVASYGLDTNPCTLGSPCRSFAHAVDATDAGGEVIVLDTGGYGTVTITKSISLIAPVGMYASVTVPLGTYGITINAGADDQVLIKGLTIKGTSGSLSGIRTNTVGTLIVDNCFISGLGYEGIDFRASNSELVILNSKINDNGLEGVLVSISSGMVSVSMNNIEMVNNECGLDIGITPLGTGSINATVTNSISNQNTVGFINGDSGSGTSVLNLEHCIVSGNSSYGIYSNNNSAGLTRLSNCTVTGNAYGVYKLPSSSGTIYSRQNNTVIGNTTNSNATLTSFSPM